MKKTLGYIGIFVLCVMFGFLLMLQMKSVKYNASAAQDSQILRASELQSLLNKEKEKSEKLLNELLTYKDELNKFREEASNSGTYAKVLAKQLENAEIMAGITTVSGQGVVVTMKDSSTTAAPGFEESYYLIHDEDILKVVNELRDAGAEAISINGERLVSTSEIRCAGSIVSINNNRYAAPYVIRAIGDAATMESALKMRDGVIDSLRDPWGIEVTVERKDKIVIEGYNGGTQFKYAVPEKTETAQ